VEQGEVLRQLFGISLAGHDRQQWTPGMGRHARQEEGAGGRRHDQTTRQVREMVRPPPIHQRCEWCGHPLVSVAALHDLRGRAGARDILVARRTDFRENQPLVR